MIARTICAVVATAGLALPVGIAIGKSSTPSPDAVMAELCGEMGGEWTTVDPTYSFCDVR